jgi:hypothetical protein
VLVYGDHAAIESTRDKLLRIETRWAEACAMPAGIRAHSASVTAFIEAAELLQGVADADLERSGWDEPSRAQREPTVLLMHFAADVWSSWTSGFAHVKTGAARLKPGDLPSQIEIKKPEGYAFYALYPEAYGEAASRAGLGHLLVIGIRSIGTGLSAMVAAAGGGPYPNTVRPLGHPFRRSVRPGPKLERALLQKRDAYYAIVDEGPGLSGSSFGAVADWLESKGVGQDRIYFFPGHSNDLGPEASEAHRGRWKTAQRHVIDMPAILASAANPAHRLVSWIADVIGPVHGPLEDIAAGRWRALRFPREAKWPPAHLQQERLKYLVRSGSGTWLCKFAGLGREGEEKNACAAALTEADYTPAVAGLRHGFIIERWLDPGAALESVPRARLIDRVGDYLGFRARHLLDVERPGASLSALREMALRNIAEALGETAARRLRSSLPDLADRRARPVVSDNRMHAWEWLHDGKGLVVKADAIDHARAHDLVGCQDIAWDIAGALVELRLRPEELDQMCTIVESHTGREIDPLLVRYLTPCYLAFQLGYYALAERALAFSTEAPRLREARERYQEYLSSLLSKEAAGDQPWLPALSDCTILK